MPDTLTVHLADRSYDILLGGDPCCEAKTCVGILLGSGRKLAVLTDTNVAKKQAKTLNIVFGDAPVLTVKPGERSKSLRSLGQVLDFLAEQGFDRTGALWAVGGGVVGDLAGFAASAYLRGIDYYQVPTTLLAMVDSSVGGKTGINLRAGKNLAGAFHQPRGVFIATDLLSTLPRREFAAGMAEVIKYGMLGDAELFTQLEGARLRSNSAELAGVIRRCCELKARIVEADERELARQDGRALLNLGHTFGHALEQATDYRRYLHGEAVAVGLAAAARLSQHLGLIPAADVSRVEAVLAAHRLPVRLSEAVPLATLLAAMTHDKKARASRSRFVVLRRLGEAATRDDVPPPLVETVWREVGAV